MFMTLLYRTSFFLDLPKNPIPIIKFLHFFFRLIKSLSEPTILKFRIFFSISSEFLKLNQLNYNLYAWRSNQCKISRDLLYLKLKFFHIPLAPLGIQIIDFDKFVEIFSFIFGYFLYAFPKFINDKFDEFVHFLYSQNQKV